MANVRGACAGLPLIFVVVLAGGDVLDSIGRSGGRGSKTYP